MPAETTSIRFAILSLLLLPLLTFSPAQAQSYSDQVQEMYVAYYGRPGDPGGVEFWADQLTTAGGELSSIIDDFGNSTEYTDRFSGQDNETLINNIYLSILNRDADSGGLEFYLARLDSGDTLANIALVIADGIEDGNSDADIFNNKLAVAAAFTLSVEEQGADYGADQIDAAVALISSVDGSQTSVDTAIEDIDSVLGTAVSNDNVDLTDKKLTNRSASCSNYAGTYFSNVTDITRDMSFMGDIVIIDEGTVCSLQSNDIPNHDFNDQTAAFANNVEEQNFYYEIPTNPSFASGTTALALGMTEVIMLNGVNLDILPAACYDVGDESLGQEKIGCSVDQIDNPWRYDPMSSLNNFGTDIHNAHTQPGGLYHYHGNPVAMFTQDCGNVTSSSPVIGFAADGYPLFGSCFLDTGTDNYRAAASSYVLKSNGGQRQDVSGYTTPEAGVGQIASNNYDGQFRGDWEYQQGAGDLDECNGMTVDGQYGYYVTDTFPWIINCLKGTPDDSFGGVTEMRAHAHPSYP